ncbi:hypothetical protein [Catenovulum maritimum]|uniref:Uncharacterized protein n=1 Tax=Catenovulum maritimum TaxID=1513271 RepID=A0A0J8JKW4_9ALTE|nr:hypothetical protein [Catenovulum maritimum]KMT65166.1 hypothetical protein XM47_10540 [Catenovulum maritimum]
MKLKTLSKKQIRNLQIYGLILCGYVLWCFVTDRSLEFVFIIIAIVQLLVSFYFEEDQRLNSQLPIVQNPTDYLRFSNDEIVFNNHRFMQNNIRKVAIEPVGDVVYFSLPFNPIAPGVIAGFRFPVQLKDNFESYILSHLPRVC